MDMTLHDGARSKRMSRRRKGYFSLLLTMAVLLLLELLLHGLCSLHPAAAYLLEPASKHDAESPILDDGRLGLRPRPNHGDHDRRGYRNPAALDTAAIICLGDSQTYGTGVPSHEAWPQRLSELCNPSGSVYSMSCPGWGPAETNAVLPEALGLEPRLVIQGFYSGNDLWDCFAMVYERNGAAEFATSSTSVQRSVEKAERKERLGDRIRALFRIYCGDFSGDKAPGLRSENESNALPSTSIRTVLSEHSRIYGVARALKNELLPDNTPALNSADWQTLLGKVDDSGGAWEAFDSGGIRTILVPRYRLTAIDMDDPRIQEGFRIAKTAIGATKRKLTERNVRFLVLLIPTKLLVFYSDMPSPSSSYSLLVENELKMWAEMKRFLDEADVEYVDALPALQGQLKLRTSPYRITADGHPNSVGHKAIAEAVYAWIRDSDA